MATNLFSQAAAYRRKHPSVSQSEAVKICAKANKKSPAKKKPAAVGNSNYYKKKEAEKKRRAKIMLDKEVREVQAAIKNEKEWLKNKKKTPKKISGVRKKKAAAAPVQARKKVKTKVKGNKTVVTISGISMSKVQQELNHQHSLTTALNKHKELLKQRGLTPGEKANIRRDINQYKHLITSSKQHVTQLKKSI